MLFEGYGSQLLAGTYETLALALLALAVSFALGLLGAAAKLSRNRACNVAGMTYTTLIRAVPDLVLMLLLFYSIQIQLNRMTDALGIESISVDPFVSGVMTLGFIYGAYFTETFRGAFMSVPRGQIEAGYACGMSPWQVFSRVMFPQMIRFALPGIGNNWQVIVKATALVSIIGLVDVVKVSQDAAKNTLNFFFFAVTAGAIYLAITTVSNIVLVLVEKHYSAGVRRVAP